MKYPAWQYVAPNDNEPKTKTVKGNAKPYNWFPCHNLWGQHTPAECQLKKKVEAEKAAQKHDTAHTATDEEQDSNQEQQAIREEEQDVFKMLAPILESEG